MVSGLVDCSTKYPLPVVWKVLIAASAACSWSVSAGRAAGAGRVVQGRPQQVGGGPAQPLGPEASHRVGDARTDVAALGDVPGVSEARHQLGPRLREPAEGPAEVGRAGGEG